MIGWQFQNIPNHIVVSCRECHGPALMEDPFIEVFGSIANAILSDQDTRSIQVGGAAIIERFPDALRWSEARGVRFSFVDRTLGVVSCPKCVNRYAHKLDWPGDAFYQIEYAGKVLWAWNREYLVMVREFISSPSRDTYGSVYLRRMIPKIFLRAKHRDELIKKIDAFLTLVPGF